MHSKKQKYVIITFLFLDYANFACSDILKYI